MPTRARGPFADAVIVAAGQSSRMGGIDKLDAPILGRPLLGWSLDGLAGARRVRRLIVVVAPERLDRLAAAGYVREHAATVVAGGERRSDSVRHGLAATDAEIVLVHDGARPLVSPALVDAVADAADEHGAAAPVLPVVDSLKHAVDGRLAAVERSGLLRAQTPQAARRQLLVEAFAAAGDRAFTDEASLLESNGVRVAAVAGEAHNIKVTLPSDLELVRAVAAGRAGEPRIGFGSDVHPFGPAVGLRLGGLTIDGAPALHGHSDGDVALHALATALLAAAGMGDIGRLFPSDDDQHAGAASTDLLTEAVRRLAEAGWRPAGASVGIVGARPRLGAERLEEMRRRIGDLVGLAAESVSVTASTGNLTGDEGAGRAISATAVATVVRT